MVLYFIVLYTPLHITYLYLSAAVTALTVMIKLHMEKFCLSLILRLIRTLLCNAAVAKKINK